MEGLGRANFRRQSAARAKTAVLLVLVALSACSRIFDPPLQARFEIDGCTPTLAGVDPDDMEWQVSPEPILQRGDPGEWDSVDVLNPSVVRHGDRYVNLYSGYDGNTWHTGLAVSDDGVTWRKEGRVLSPRGWEGSYIAANGSAVVVGERIFYWYQAGPRDFARIALARSMDGKDWAKEAKPVLTPGPRGSWDESGVADPYVISCGGWFYMFYLGQNRYGRQRLGLARSRDGVHWQKERRNPLIAGGGPGLFDERGVGEPAVFRAGEDFYMLYVGRDGGERREIGWAKSPNGVDWRKLENAPRLSGTFDWNRATVCDPEVMAFSGRLWVFFGAGDKPSPDENLNGVIGRAVLTSR